MRTSEPVSGKIRHIVRIDLALRLVWRSGPFWTMASGVLMLLQGVLPLLALYLMKLIVDAVASGATAMDQDDALRQVAIYIGLTGLVALTGVLCGSLTRYVNEAQSQTVTDYVLDLLHSRSMAMDLSYYENPDYFDTMHRAQMEAPFRPVSIQQGLVGLGRNLLSLGAVTGLLFTLHWGMAVILLGTALPGLLVRIRHAGRLYDWQRQHTMDERRALYYNYILTGDQHAKEVRLFNLGPLFRKQFSELRGRLRRGKIALASQRARGEGYAAALAILAVFATYVFIASKALQGLISIGALVMYFQAFQRGQQFLKEALVRLAGLYEDNLFLSNLYEFLDLEPHIVAPADPLPPPRPLRKGIALNQVNFRYPGADREVLHDIDITVKPGEHVALVGRNGSGKSTIVKLLCRLYDPTDGDITMDGIDLRRFDPVALRRELSVIFQDFARYNLTAAENIQLGNIETPPDRDSVVAAAKFAGANDFIASLPRGYDALLGRWFEEGKELSLGEWQKVALARGFLRDGQVIILDEPASSQDARAEIEFLERLQELTRNKTTILISHRLSSVRKADRILVLDKGRIVESGSHDELILRDGHYARLFVAQARQTVKESSEMDSSS